MGEFLRINRKNLYIEIVGKNCSPTILFIHGGPGGVGVIDFIDYQGDRLSKEFRIIAPEQRGVWRSEAIEDNEDISLEDIINDYEEIRKTLHINKWSILCHSFGGYIAVQYANLYPDAIECIMFENPIFDFSLTERSILKYQAKKIAHLGNYELADKYFKVLRSEDNYKYISALLKKASKELGANANDYLWFKQSKEIMDKMININDESRRLWEKSVSTRRKILKDWQIYNADISRLSNIDKPCLLLKGKYDVMTCEVQIEEFMNRVTDKKLVEFEYSSHWVRIEEPDRYCEVVVQFMNSIAASQRGLD